MTTLKHLLGVLAVFCILLFGCKKEVGSESSLASGSERTTALQQGGVGGATLNEPISITNPLFQDNKNEEVYQELVRQTLAAITPTPCNSSTPIRTWLTEQRSDWTQELRDFATAYAMTSIPADYAYLFENSSSNQVFGSNGEYTQTMNKTFKDLNRFWQMESRGIVLTAMHGTTLNDRTKVVKTIEAYGYPTADAEYFADIILGLLATHPQYRGGDHPYFTFNAFAARSVDAGPYGILPYKIIMGDGVMHGYSAIGYADVAPQAILAHEYGHQVQYLYNLIPSGPRTPEITRRVELLADAFSAYFLSHAKGGAMQWKRVQQFLQVFFNIGDCGFTSTGHHGTPTQRMAAAEWAYKVVSSTQKQGHILTVEQFVALFDAQLPTLVTL